ncbi:glycosyltransferase family 4 protein [Ferrimonas sediminicola]|uniref:Glycosyltransferase family 4 protein n=1 Tax=Ferrimonas sediminicola TaxID=2569538 RepID=A0A4V5NUK0_9GAMM|nr:glycosyltransferase family 4 protein [Ferrimonas sediminicola]TKB46807.1 glycosyltransferase family 4 protein [Ferrimonas sediminicola]
MPESSLKVIHVVRQFHPGIGGLEKFVQALVEAQREAGIDASVVTLNRLFHQPGSPRLPREELVEGIPVRRVHYLGSYKYPIAPGVLTAIAPADLVHVHGIDFFFDFLALTRALHRKPLVASTHGGFFHTQFAARLKRAYFRSITRFSSRAYHHVLAISQGDFSTFSRICQPPRLKLVENGADIGKFRGGGSRTPTRGLIFIGRFSDNKRLDKLVDGFAHLARLDPAYRLDIAGRDWDNNLGRLRRQIERLGLTQRVRLHLGLSDQQLTQLAGQNSFVVSASEYEGFGQTLLEGMAAGLYPIASPIPSFRRVVEATGIGTCLSFDDPQRWARQAHQRINQVLEEYAGNRRQAMRACGAFSFEQCCRAMIEIYQQMLGGREPPVDAQAMERPR